MRKFAIWNGQNRPGDFEFLESTQSKWTGSLNTIEKEYRARLNEPDSKDYKLDFVILELVVSTRNVRYI